MRAKRRVLKVRVSYSVCSEQRSDRNTRNAFSYAAMLLESTAARHRSQRRRTRGAEEIYEETVGAWDAFGKLAEEGDPGVDVDTLAVTGVHDRAILLGLTGIPHSKKRCVLR